MKVVEEIVKRAYLDDGCVLSSDETQPLVRCKDCKYNDDGECIIKAGWFPVKDDWFCADGQRRDED